MSLLSDLLHFREVAARQEGIESFKVLSKANIDAIAFARPKTKEELTAIKGIKEAKYNKYGQALLAIVASHTIGDFSEEEEVIVSEEPGVLSVNQFLEAINTELSGMAARVQGEITELNIWQSRVVFFALKDKVENSTLRCSMSYQHFQLAGGNIAIGTEVIAEGYPKIYKPRGEMSFQVTTLELFGEGALKKAYDELFKKLEIAGAFDPSLKKPIPEFPERIALITSLDGAALGDFQMNIGRFGLKIDLYPSGVEGSRAIHELLSAVRRVSAKAKQYDVLVIVRGGGSLESLQAFNNEALVEAVRNLPLPVLAGIGHERDITLTALVADRMESTPTACALFLTSYWEAARENMFTYSEKLPRLLEKNIAEKKERMSLAHHLLFQMLAEMKEKVLLCERQFLFCLERCRNELKALQSQVKMNAENIEKSLNQAFFFAKKKLEDFESLLAQMDPNRVLALGYSLVWKNQKIIRSTDDLSVNDILDIRLGNGKLSVTIKKIET